MVESIIFLNKERIIPFYILVKDFQWLCESGQPSAVSYQLFAHGAQCRRYEDEMMR
jgi:hypothetical protein